MEGSTRKQATSEEIQKAIHNVTSLYMDASTEQKCAMSGEERLNHYIQFDPKIYEAFPVQVSYAVVHHMFDPELFKAYLMDPPRKITEFAEKQSEYVVQLHKKFYPKMTKEQLRKVKRSTKADLQAEIDKMEDKKKNIEHKVETKHEKFLREKQHELLDFINSNYTKEIDPDFGFVPPPKSTQIISMDNFGEVETTIANKEEDGNNSNENTEKKSKFTQIELEEMEKERRFMWENEKKEEELYEKLVMGGKSKKQIKNEYNKKQSLKSNKQKNKGDKNKTQKNKKEKRKEKDEEIDKLIKYINH